MLTFPKTPITDSSFTKWNAIKQEEENDEDGSTYHYYIIPLPNGEDDDNTLARPALLSTASDECNIIGIKKGEYKISVFEYGELPLLQTEEDVELLYKIITQQDLVQKKK